MTTTCKIVVKNEGAMGRRGGARFSAAVFFETEGQYQTELHPLGILEKTPNAALHKAIDHLPGWTQIHVEYKES